MKIEMTFTLITDVKTDDFNDAEALAKIKADAIIIQTLGVTGYRLKYKNLSFSPDIEEKLNRLKNTLNEN